MSRPYYLFYHYYLKTIADIKGFLESFNDLSVLEKRKEEISKQLNKLTLSHKTKYMIASHSQQIQTTEGDKGYKYEVELHAIEDVLRISTFVLERQIKEFKGSFYNRYRDEITR